MKVQVKSHMSVVEDDEVDRVHSVFQRKRQLARENYAKAHNLNPDQLKNVAALKPLEKPVAPEEPETKKEDQEEGRQEEEGSRQAQGGGHQEGRSDDQGGQEGPGGQGGRRQGPGRGEGRARGREGGPEAELAAKREEHAKTRIVKSTAAKLVKKVDVDAREAEEAKAAEALDDAAAESRSKPKMTRTDPRRETGATPTPETETAYREAQPKRRTADRGDRRGSRCRRGRRARAGHRGSPGQGGTKKNDGFKVGDIIKPAPKVKKPRPKAGQAPDRGQQRLGARFHQGRHPATAGRGGRPRGIHLPPQADPEKEEEGGSGRGRPRPEADHGPDGRRRRTQEAKEG